MARDPEVDVVPLTELTGIDGFVAVVLVEPGALALACFGWRT